MYNSPYEPTGNPRHTRSTCGPRSGLLRRILIAVTIGVALSLLLGPVLWALGVAFHLVSVIIRLAVLGAIGWVVWRRISRRHDNRRGI